MKVIDLNIGRCNTSMQEAVKVILNLLPSRETSSCPGHVLELGETYKELTLSVEGKDIHEALSLLGVKEGDVVKLTIDKQDND